MSRAQVADDTSFPHGFNAMDCSTELNAQFAQYHLANPDVYQTLVRLAREAKEKGKRPGIKMLFEVARWYYWLDTIKGDGFNLNNSFTSRYARLIMQQEKDLSGFFHLRELRS